MPENYEISRGMMLYWARIIPNLDVYDVIDMRVRTVCDTYFTAVDNRTKHVHLIGNNYLGKTVFKDRMDAVEMVRASEEYRKPVSHETYYEEY